MITELHDVWERYEYRLHLEARWDGTLRVTTVVGNGRDRDEIPVNLDLDSAKELARVLVDFLRNHPKVKR